MTDAGVSETEKPMTGFLATLSEDQRRLAMEYCGDDFLAPPRANVSEDGQ